MPWKKIARDAGQQDWVLGTVSPDSTFVMSSVGSSQATTTVQATFPLATNVKISKVALSWSAVGLTDGSHKFNIVLGNGSNTAGTVAANDNSTVNGYPTNYASTGVALFAADVPISSGANYAYGTFAQGQGYLTCTASGGSGVFIPTSYDAVYPVGNYLTLRLTTPGASGLFSSLAVALLLEARPIPPTYVTQTANASIAGNNPNALPGWSF